MQEVEGTSRFWWEKLYSDRQKREKENTKNWDRIRVKLKGKLLPMSQSLNFLRRLQKLKQMEMLVNEYME